MLRSTNWVRQHKIGRLKNLNDVKKFATDSVNIPKQADVVIIGELQVALVYSFFKRLSLVT